MTVTNMTVGLWEENGQFLMLRKGLAKKYRCYTPNVHFVFVSFSYSTIILLQWRNLQDSVEERKAFRCNVPCIPYSFKKHNMFAIFSHIFLPS